MKAKRILSVTAMGLTVFFVQPSPAHAIWESYEVVDTCEWSNAVMIRHYDGVYATRGSGVYVGQDVVLTAGHVVIDAVEGGDDIYIEFGEVGGDSVLTVQADCVVHPGYEEVDAGGLGGGTKVTGEDIAYCILQEHPELLDEAFGGDPLDFGSLVLPMAPTGCERDYLYQALYSQPEPVYTNSVGLGCELEGASCDSSSEFGDKRAVQTEFVRQSSNITPGVPLLEVYQPQPHDVTDPLIRGPVQSGDSGGPLYVTMPDGSARLIGVANQIRRMNNYQGSGDYHNFIDYAPVPIYLRWIENSSGADLTPCYDWQSGQGYVYQGGDDGVCDVFHGDPTPNSNAWSDGCYDASSLVPATRCGGWDRPPVTDITLPPAPDADSSLDLAFWTVTSDPRADMVLFAAPTIDEALGSRGPDELVFRRGKQIVRAGAGDDFIVSGNGRDSVFGGTGDDMISTGNGVDYIYPGPGDDIVQAGRGDDVVFIYDLCEVGSREVLVGGKGRDTLVSPAPVEVLRRLGVSVKGFEEVIVTDQLSRGSVCRPIDSADILRAPGQVVERSTEVSR